MFYSVSMWIGLAFVNGQQFLRSSVFHFLHGKAMMHKCEQKEYNNKLDTIPLGIWKYIVYAIANL